jgi:hypothetical protein
MDNSRDLPTLFAEAEQAAVAGDYVAAERLLREAADQQEASLGPFHPDLANTLNNLGVVYETIDRPADAERCYRRAYSIALASLEPDHPFVSTSEKNFRDFCEARGIPLELPKPLPPLAPAPSPAPSLELQSEPEVRQSLPELPPVPEPQPSLPDVRSSEPRTARVAYAPAVPPPRAPALPQPFPMAAVGLAAVVVLVAAALWFGANRMVESPQRAEAIQDASAPVALDKAGRSAVPPAVEPVSAVTKTDAPSVVEPAPPARGEKTVASAAERPGRAVSEAAPKVERAIAPAPNRRTTAATPGLTFEANLCSELSSRDWRCHSAGRSVDSGVLFFYTRIKSPAGLTIEHRWYWNDRLHRKVALRVQSNDRSGFRTYSRTAVKRGDWRVELRTREGALLHTENFVVH